jgi:hypothetical protein
VRLTCSLLNPVFLFVLICLAGFWFYVSSAAASETPEQPMTVFGKPVSPDQRKIGMMGSTSTHASVAVSMGTISLTRLFVV